jgi:hypothetical protein
MKVTTGECRLSYCHLTQARANSQRPNDPPKFGVTLLIPKSDYATKQRIDAAIEAAKQEGRAKKWNGVIPPAMKSILHDGDGVKQNGLPFGPECKGHWVMTASSKDRPRVVDLDKQDILDTNQIYSGMYGRAAVRFYPFSTSGNVGIACGLNNVQKTRDGEPMANRSSAEEDFAEPANMGIGAPPYGAPAYTQQPNYPAAAQPYGQQPAYASPAPVQPQYQQPAYAPQAPAQPYGQLPAYQQPYQAPQQSQAPQLPTGVYQPQQGQQYQPPYTPQAQPQQPAPQQPYQPGQPMGFHPGQPAIDPVTGMPVDPRVFGV